MRDVEGHGHIHAYAHRSGLLLDDRAEQAVFRPAVPLHLVPAARATALLSGHGRPRPGRGAWETDAAAGRLGGDARREEGNAMFVAMNRFKVAPGAEAEFEEVWTSRDTHLREVPGFVEFHLLRGPQREDHVLYASHTIWRSREHFEAWTRSEAFRMAHRGAGGSRPLYVGHPEFEGFEAIQTVTPAAA